ESDLEGTEAGVEHGLPLVKAGLAHDEHAQAVVQPGPPNLVAQPRILFLLPSHRAHSLRRIRRPTLSRRQEAPGRGRNRRVTGPPRDRARRRARSPRASEGSRWCPAAPAPPPAGRPPP